MTIDTIDEKSLCYGFLIGLHEQGGIFNMRGDVGIEWVIYDGNVVHVSDFAGVRPQDRPAVLCYECMKPVTLKLGNVLAYHAAHPANRLAEDWCLLGDQSGSSESINHFNCKMRIYDQLRRSSVLHGEYKCRRCQGSETSILCKDWTEVRVERRLDNGFTPDITLVNGDSVVMGIEVMMSHAVDKRKAKALAERGIEWVEVVATKTLTDKWTAADPIPLRHHSLRPNMICKDCLGNPRVYQKAKKEIPDPIEHFAPGEGKEYPGRSCVTCGETKIVYLSNSGPLCAGCFHQRPSADNLALGWGRWVPTREEALRLMEEKK